MRPAGTNAPEFDVQFDVLVIGAGGCGLAAALAAHDAAPDIEVAVVEKADRLQGNTMLSSGSIPAAGTRLQREAGLHDSPADFVEDLRHIAGEHEMSALAHRLAGVSAELVDWLTGAVGARLTLVETYKHIGHRQFRLHAPPSRRGSDLMDELARALERRGIPLAYGNPALELLTEPGEGVVGVITSTPDGVRTAIGARAVILAANGFGANRALLARYCPEVAEVPYGGSPTSEGEALQWGEALDAALANMGAYQAHASLADPHGSLVTWTVVEKGGVIVDGQGRRFGDESIGYSAFASLELARTGPFYVVADTRVRDLTAAGQDEYAELVRHNGVVEAPDAQALAARLGLPGDVLATTLVEAAAAARGERADLHGRTHWGLGPLSSPYTATRIGPALFHTQGGLRVDDDARVLRPDGKPIPGLYAGGGAAAGISGRHGSSGYMSGNGLLAALGLGYLAGRAAVGDILQRH